MVIAFFVSIVQAVDVLLVVLVNVKYVLEYIFWLLIGLNVSLTSSAASAVRLIPGTIPVIVLNTITSVSTKLSSFLPTNFRFFFM